MICPVSRVAGEHAQQVEQPAERAVERVVQVVRGIERGVGRIDDPGPELQALEHAVAGEPALGVVEPQHDGDQQRAAADHQQGEIGRVAPGTGRSARECSGRKTKEGAVTASPAVSWQRCVASIPSYAMRRRAVTMPATGSLPMQRLALLIAVVVLGGGAACSSKKDDFSDRPPARPVVMTPAPGSWVLSTHPTSRRSSKARGERWITRACFC